MQKETKKDNLRNNKIALVFGVGGQDGSYLAEFLLRKGYDVHGVVRPASTFNRQRIDHIFGKGKREKFLHYGDLTDPWSVLNIISKVKPTEIYNLGAMSHVHISWKMPYYSAQVDALGVLNVLEAVRFVNPKIKVYQASTSELFSGRLGEAPQDEKTTKDPISPYGTAKLYGFQICKNYREAYGMFICNGILFNHESPRRGDNFVTKKITNSVKTGKVSLGNLDSKRDWGYAPEYVEGMWKMLQQKNPDDYVLATGDTHSIKDFIKWTEEVSGIKLKIKIDKRYVRPKDVSLLKGNPTKARKKLKWKAKTTKKELVKKMLC